MVRQENQQHWRCQHQDENIPSTLLLISGNGRLMQYELKDAQQLQCFFPFLIHQIAPEARTAMLYLIDSISWLCTHHQCYLARHPLYSGECMKNRLVTDIGRYQEKVLLLTHLGLIQSIFHWNKMTNVNEIYWIGSASIIKELLYLMCLLENGFNFKVQHILYFYITRHAVSTQAICSFLDLQSSLHSWNK